MTIIVTIPVDVDTRKASAKQKQLHRDKGRAQKRVNSAARRTSRLAVRAFAFTGAAAAMNRDIEPSGNVSVFEEALTPYFAQIQQKTDDELGRSARAYRSAREQTKAAFAYQVGRTGELAGMRDFFDTANRIEQDVESGRNLIRRDPRFTGPGIGEVTDAGIAGNVKVFLENLSASNPFRSLIRGFDYIVEGIEAE